MKISSVTKNPYLLFLPLLILYTLFILVFQAGEIRGDEIRYLRDVDHLLHGYYSPPAPDIILASGPGYQLFILPLIALKLPLLIIRLLNGGLLYLSVVLLFKVLISFLSFRKALLFSLFWAFYYNSFYFLTLIYSETLTLFLVSALVFLLFKIFGTGTTATSKKNIFLAGFTLGYLVLTKVIFAYVVICMLPACGLLWLLNRSVINYKKSVVVLLIAFGTLLPYLCYTYQLTGRIFYLSTQGGNNLYWMSTAHENEYGSWFATPMIRKDSTVNTGIKITSATDAKTRAGFLPGYEDSLLVHNRKDLEEISAYDNKGLELDDVYQRLAIKNIKANPGKFLYNCFCNAGRILFNFPYSYTLQKPATLLRLPLNGVILLLALFCLIPTFNNWKKIPYAIRFMFFLSAIYFGGSMLGCAEIRMFTVIVPVLLAWIAFTINKSVHFNVKKWEP